MLNSGLLTADDDDDELYAFFYVFFCIIKRLAILTFKIYLTA